MTVMLRKTSVPHSVDLQSSATKHKTSKRSSVENIIVPTKTHRPSSTINQLNIGSAFCQKLGNRSVRADIVLTPSGNSKNSLQRSMQDIGDKKLGNCMINNLYFIPKLLKSKKGGDSVRPRMNISSGQFIESVRNTKRNFSKLFVRQPKAHHTYNDSERKRSRG